MQQAREQKEKYQQERSAPRMEVSIGFGPTSKQLAEEIANLKEELAKKREEDPLYKKQIAERDALLRELAEYPTP